MKNTGITAALLILIGCSQPTVIDQFQLKNDANVARKEVISLDVATSGIKMTDALDVKVGESVCNYELLDNNADGTADQLLAQVSLVPESTSAMKITKSDKPAAVSKLTQAEISVKEGGEWVEVVKNNGNEQFEYKGGEWKNVDKVEVPDQHTDHSFWIRYEGPGWESDLVGYRFYLDWRNGVDIFGKVTNEMALQNVGLDGFDSYHELSDWGMDVLKVGPSLGLGSIGRYLDSTLYRFENVENLTCEISRNGQLESIITTTYDKWATAGDTTSLKSVMSIRGGSRMTKHEVSLTNPISGFCTGLVVNKGEEYIKESQGDYTVIATYGVNSLNKDNLGMAVIVKNDEVESIFDGAASHVALFKPSEQVTYYFLAAWELEPNGIKSVDAFKAYLNEELAKLNSPIQVSK